MVFSRVIKFCWSWKVLVWISKCYQLLLTLKNFSAAFPWIVNFCSLCEISVWHFSAGTLNSLNRLHLQNKWKVFRNITDHHIAEFSSYTDTHSFVSYFYYARFPRIAKYFPYLHTIKGSPIFAYQFKSSFQLLSSCSELLGKSVRIAFSYFVVSLCF